ncbi:ABC transporter permease [Actinotignum sanguinis]|uniref:ABC transporter permease n=1 Tax=Actinotignum sanguinis TaxID=1445614 RepID=UPI0029345562|nr:ABC transporter permease [Actinotignum sanguinis]MDV2437721.1 ABC transporter permease [Actinotignum sanguinis]
MSENRSKTTVASLDPEHVVEVDDAQLASSSPSYSQGRLVLRRFLRHKPAMVSAVVLILVTLVAFLSIGWNMSFFGLHWHFSGLWRHNYMDVLDVVNNGKPTMTWTSLGEHPFGQDNIGKDYFALTMKGTQISIIIAFVVGLVSTIIGTIIGAAAGYFRGWTEAILMRITNLFIVIPLLILAAVIGKMVGSQGILFLAVMLGVLSWTGLARLVRGEVLSLREREFVASARALGASPWRIIFRHILPNCLGTIIVSATLSISSAILLETSLSFLGFGVRPPATSLGLLISTYQTTFSTRPWLFFAPAGLILIIALSINFIGDGLRDAFDPRQRSAVSRRKMKALAEGHIENDVEADLMPVTTAATTATGGEHAAPASDATERKGE